jgi:hypothetical protein
MSDGRMPPQEAHVEAFLESLADVTVPGDLVGAVSASVRERPSRRPSLRLPLLAAAAGLLLTVSVAMAAGWTPPFDILPGPQGSVTLPPVASAEASPPAFPVPTGTWEWATLVAENVEMVVDPVTMEPAGAWPRTDTSRLASVLVLGRRVVADRTWVRIEVGGWGGEASFVWIPETVPSVAPTGYLVNTLAPTTWVPCDTSGPPTIESLGSLTAAQRLACTGGASFTTGPAKVAGTWDDTANTGTPDWLAGPITITLQVPIDPAGRVATLPVRVKPGSGITLLPDTWVTVTAHFGDPASASCVRRTSDVSEAPVGEPSDQVLWCRQQLVIEGATMVPAPASAPPTPAPYPSPEGIRSSLLMLSG